MLSVILCDGYLEARHSAFERIGTVTSCRVCDMAPDSAVAPQPVTVPFNPAKVFAEKNNKSFFTWFYAIDIFFSLFFLSKAFRNIILIKKIKFEKIKFEKVSRGHVNLNTNLSIFLVWMDWIKIGASMINRLFCVKTSEKEKYVEICSNI